MELYYDISLEKLCLSYAAQVCILQDFVHCFLLTYDKVDSSLQFMFVNYLILSEMDNTWGVY